MQVCACFEQLKRKVACQNLGELLQICITYTDEVMLREAAGSNVVLQKLLREVLMHLCCFMGIPAISKGFVQVYEHNTTL